MFRTLLTPLKAHFDFSPPISGHDGETSPEDFARDVLIELMRNAMENLKTSDTIREKTEILTEIQKIMLQDAHTKSVFRELDGFVVLMNVLSTIQSCNGSPIHEPDEQVLLEVLETIRMVFMIVSDAINEHPENSEYFKVSVGYDSLALALTDLVADRRTVDVTLGFLLSMSLNDFSISGIFTSLRGTPVEELDQKIKEFESRLGLIRLPGAIHLLWAFEPQLSAGDSAMRYAFFKLFERLCVTCHRNQAMLSSIGIVKSVMEYYSDSRSWGDAEKQVVQKLLRRLLDLGATAPEARLLFQRMVMPEEQSLNTETLEILKSAMKSRWPDHFSLESPAEFIMVHDGVRGVPSTGFTFAMWFWIEALPKITTHAIFSVRTGSTSIVDLRLNTDGNLELQTSAHKSVTVFGKSNIHTGRWTHVTLVHHPHKTSQPSIRLFIDGVLVETLMWAYPRSDLSAQSVEYVVGSSDSEAQMSWCIATAYLITRPLGDELPRLIHHLGPRYQGNFQDPALIQFLTYEASTSLNMFISATVSKAASAESLSLVKVVREGLGISNSSIIFSLSTTNIAGSGTVRSLTMSGTSKEVTVQGDVAVVKAACLDMSLWKIGGVAVPLRLLQVAKTPHEISGALSILTDSLRNSWQNSEDMERLRGYELLPDILWSKAQQINMTSFETLFEALGLNFRLPEQSTIVNAVAYKAIALDFEFWSRTRKEVQRVYLEHFITLLQTSRYKTFNIKQRMAKLGLIRRLLFVLQTEWYQHDIIPHLIEVLKAAAQANFSKEETIKPMVSYIAARLNEVTSTSDSPRSMVSRIDYKDVRQKAEQVLELLVSLLLVPTFYNKFITALPITRICLLLLGDKPQPFVANQVLLIIGISVKMSASFTRKFELISGWNILKTVLPMCWDPSVNEAAFDILLGRTGITKIDTQGHNAVVCPQIVPAIFAALQTGLGTVGNNCTISEEGGMPNGFSWATESTIEVLVEELIDLHASSATFRQVFRSQQATRLFIEANKSFVSQVSAAPSVNQRASRILEKMTHFGLALALDGAVAGVQKRVILDILRDAETVLNPSSKQQPTISPELVADTRSIRQRIAFARLTVDVSERTVIKIIARILEWQKTIRISELKRLRENMLDLREHRRQISRLYEWNNALLSERGLWPKTEPILWRLDETEGPHRVRNKLEPEISPPMTRIDVGLEHIRDVEVPGSETSSIVQVEVPPWAETYEISSVDVEERQLAEEIAEDKHRRVRYELEPGDVIEAVATVARVSGVDSSPGLLIIGRTHLYMLDGLVENEEGEVIDARHAPKRLLFVPGSIVEFDGPQRAQRWAHDQVGTYSKKNFLFRDVALEIYFKDSRSLLIVFLDKKKRLDVDQRLSAMINNSSNVPTTPGLLITPLLGNIGAKVLAGFRPDELATAQRKWQTREISNFTYISILNQISGRTPSDATQYPVFPWVLQDYSSPTLDLNNPESYRDLSRSMGALTEARREAAITRYESLESINEKPFHYGTHFSSSMIVCHFLIRLAPYTNMFKTLQGGDWDLPDRLFSDIARAFDSAARDVRGDVRELIPEFYTCPEFLENSRNIDFGVQQNTGERIHDVKLPPWARQDPLLFVVMNRKALESSYVSEHLASWIDLIWGCKQRDSQSLNCFHPLSYEGSVDLDSITDELEREATVGIIHNFGQTPRKLFNAPHPQRYGHASHTLPLGTLHGIEEDPHLLLQESRSFKDLGPAVPVCELVFDMIGEKIIPCPDGNLCIPHHPHEQIEWGASRVGGGELRLLVDNRVVQVIEGSFCNCASFVDSDCLVTGCTDFTVRLWKISRTHNPPLLRLSLSHIMRFHTDIVICLATSRSRSLIVSGSQDGSATLWDLNRGTYVRSIWHSNSDEELNPVHLVSVNESTGYIATCSKTKLCLHTINARCIAELDLTHSLASITSMAFHEREYSYLGILATGGSDGSIVLRTWTADGTPENERAQWEFVTIRTMKVRAVDKGVVRPPAVTALKFLGESLCHGEETGKSFMWSLPD
ncbi:beach-domain-containing protein [Guyanagaster necrorhizus]|uniref:Beach-domain-containing protein n=1 Tax=Guyanagaster necrorhizus TaxID=856835 RepID=A0A9P7VIR4_9AGAR|nr:beach-domain-containing protein [Guyanagaster necrorhizus MCA 3950]KAG7440786.1 beach-domain-containing protein [Guyanagaster necrorhizus MCA 3950]